MAIKLSSKSNTAAPNGDYPFGRIRDDDGTGNGTPVDTSVYGDFHQFFAKLASESGITLNNLPDNQTNGYQYIEALRLLSFPTMVSAGTPTMSSTGGTAGTIVVAANAMSQLYNKYKIVGKVCTWHFRAHITGTAVAPTNIIIPYPTGVSPLSILISDSASFFGFYEMNYKTVVATLANTGMNCKLVGGAGFQILTGGASHILEFQCSFEIQ